MYVCVYVLTGWLRRKQSEVIEKAKANLEAEATRLTAAFEEADAELANQAARKKAFLSLTGR